MKPEENYKELNRQAWNQRTEVHVESKFYDVEQFLAGFNCLQEIELPLLGDLSGKSVLHLQCHFGLDSLSLARMGAEVTGIDLSDKAIQHAIEINQKAGLNAQFYCGDVYDTPQLISEKFDIVFTSYGVIGWLPDMDRWAQTIVEMLKPGGKLIFAEFHPVVWMMDYDFKHIGYSYFNEKAIIEENEGTYTDREANIQYTDVSWNHGLAEVIQALISAGLMVENFQEYDFSPYNCFNNTVEISPNRYQIQGLEGKLPLVYSLVCLKK